MSVNGIWHPKAVNFETQRFITVFATSEDLATCFMLVSYLVYPLTVEIEATGSSQTLVDFQRSALLYIP
jgi:hypothetical protein